MAKAIKLSSGNWRCKANYTDENGKYRAKSFTASTKKEAEYLASEFLMQMKHKQKPENKTIGELADIYIDSRSNILSPSTILGYTKIKNRAFPKIMETRAGFVTTQMYQNALNEYAKNRSPKTVIEAHRLMMRIFKSNHIDIDESILELPERISTEIQVPETEVVKQILEESKNHGIYLPVLLAALLGLRKSEICALTWDDIDFKNETIRINKAVVKNVYGEYVIKATKTRNSTRTLHMPRQIIEALPEQAPEQGNLIGLSYEAFESRYKRMIKKMRLNYTFHSLRHYNASVMLENNVPNKYAMERMGHATDYMLKKVYQHTFEKAHKKFEKEIEDFFDENGI